MSKNQRRLPPPLRFRQRRSGNLPRSVSLVNNFFSEPRSFFSGRAAGFLPGAEAETYPGFFSLSTAFFCFFQKTFSPRRARPLGPARLSETFRPAAARTGYAPPRLPCQRLFIFFLIFLPSSFRFYRVFALVRRKKEKNGQNAHCTPNTSVPFLKAS